MNIRIVSCILEDFRSITEAVRHSASDWPEAMDPNWLESKERDRSQIGQ